MKGRKKIINAAKIFIFFLAISVSLSGIFLVSSAAQATACLCSSPEAVTEGFSPPPETLQCDEACIAGPCLGRDCAPESVYTPGPTPPSALQQQVSQTVPVLNIMIGGAEIKFDPVSCQAGETCQINWLAQYINVLYQYVIGLAGILAAAVILFGGFIWLTSFGSPEKVKQAKDYITGALTGLFLALFTYLILFTINPNLVSFNPITFDVVDPIANVAAMGPGYKGETDIPGSSGSSGTGSTGGSSSSSMNDMNSSVQDRAKQDEARAARPCGSTLRSNSPRHATGYAADCPYVEGSELNNYVLANADPNKTKELIWYRGRTTTAYYVTDANGNTTVYVQEPVTYITGEDGVSRAYNYPHWHIEYETADWNFRPSW